MDKNLLASLDPAVTGERLADARRDRRLTQQQAADALEVARTTIVAMEKGERRPRPSELIKLAQLYGRGVGEFVQPTVASSQPGFLVQFRSIKGRTQDVERERAQDIRAFEDLCRWYVDLEEIFNAPLPRRYPEVYNISNTLPERAAEEVATSERQRLGLGDGPIGDLWGMLETDIGLRVFAIPMQDRRIAGMFVYSEEFGGCIAVNANQPEERRRLSGMHEYAHFLVARHKPEITIVNAYRRAPESERFADAFARFFAMPSSGLIRRFESIRRAKNGPITPADVLALSHLFRVSFQAMTWRLEELKLLPSGTWERLRDLGFKPNKARELLDLTPFDSELPQLPVRYVALAVHAHERGFLSEGELAERLRTDRIGARESIRSVTTEQQPTETGEWQQISLDLSAPMIATS